MLKLKRSPATLSKKSLGERHGGLFRRLHCKSIYGVYFCQVVNPIGVENMQTKAFKSGNSLAVRIPKDLAIFEPSQDVIIERRGDTLVLRAVERKSLADVMDIFAQFSPDFMADGRGPEGWQDQKERDWSAWDEHAVHQDGLPYPAAPRSLSLTASAPDALAATLKRKRK